ncbi:ubiquitin protein ligase binding protein, partial [Reticulomyxa filosa]
MIKSDMNITAKTRGISQKEFLLIYTTVYNMCLQKTPGNYAEQLYNKYHETIKDYLVHYTKAKLQHCKERLGSIENEYFLIELVKQYRHYKFFAKWLIETFRYLDQHFISRTKKLPLREIASYEFYQEIFMNLRKEC